MGYDPNYVESPFLMQSPPKNFSIIKVWDWGQYSTEEDLNRINSQLEQYRAYADYPHIGGFLGDEPILNEIFAVISLVISSGWVNEMILNASYDSLKLLIRGFIIICKRNQGKCVKTNPNIVPSLEIRVGDSCFKWRGNLSNQAVEKSLDVFQSMVCQSVESKNKYVCTKDGEFDIENTN